MSATHSESGSTHKQYIVIDDSYSAFLEFLDMSKVDAEAQGIKNGPTISAKQSTIWRTQLTNWAFKTLADIKEAKDKEQFIVISNRSDVWFPCDVRDPEFMVAECCKQKGLSYSLPMPAEEEDMASGSKRTRKPKRNLLEQRMLQMNKDIGERGVREAYYTARYDGILQMQKLQELLEEQPGEDPVTLSRDFVKELYIALFQVKYGATTLDKALQRSKSEDGNSLPQLDDDDFRRKRVLLSIEESYESFAAAHKKACAQP